MIEFLGETLLTLSQRSFAKIGTSRNNRSSGLAASVRINRRNTLDFWSRDFHGSGIVGQTIGGCVRSRAESSTLARDSQCRMHSLSNYVCNKMTGPQDSRTRNQRNQPSSRIPLAHESNRNRSEYRSMKAVALALRQRGAVVSWNDHRTGLSTIGAIVIRSPAA